MAGKNANARAETISLIRSLRAAHKAAGVRVRRRKVPAPIRPIAIQSEYLKVILAEVLVPMRDLVGKTIIPELDGLVAEAARERGDAIIPELDGIVAETARERGDTRHDASPDKARALIERIARQFSQEVGPEQIARMAARIGKRTSDFQREQLRRQIKAAMGVDPLMREPASIAARIEHFTSENVALIKSVPQKFFGDVEKRVTAGVRAGQRAEELAGEIQERYGVAESDATRIAKDQVGKFVAEMNKVRQTELGIDKFVWRSMGDNRVRPEHEDYDGNTYSWTSPPEGGPGQPVLCRCWAEPDLSGFLE